MKRIGIVLVVALLALILVISFAGCGPTTPPTDEELINAVLDSYQSGMKNENVDQVVGCVTYPFTYAIFTFNNETSFRDYLTNLIFPLSTFQKYELINRSISVTGSNATITCTESVQNNGGAESNTDATILAVKIGGNWKGSSMTFDTSPSWIAPK